MELKTDTDVYIVPKINVFFFSSFIAHFRKISQTCWEFSDAEVFG